MLRAVFAALRTEDRGQDLAEYCLLTALVALVAVGILVHFSGGLQAIWNSASSTTVAAGNTASAATSSTATSTPAH